MSEKAKFTFMETYLETVEQLKEHDPAKACELLHAIIDYGLYGKESENPLIKALMVQIKYAIDTGKQISLQNSENGKKGGAKKGNRNAVKDFEKVSKQPKTSEDKQKQTETSENKQKENKKENKNNNLNTLSSNEDNGASTEYGNSEINECIEIIKSFNGGMIDGTQKRNRIYGKNLIGKLKHSPPVQNGFTWQNTLQAILQIVSNNKFHRSKITNPKSIYDNLTLLLQLCEQEGMQNQVIQTL